VRCLDVRLTALGVVEGMLADPAHPETIDQAMTMVRGLPALDDCADEDALLAGVAPPAADVAPQVAALDQRLAEAKAKDDAGLFQDAKPALEALRSDAEQLGYLPTQVAIDQALGELRLEQMDSGAADDFAAAAALATRARLDRDAARALAGQVQAEGQG